MSGYFKIYNVMFDQVRTNKLRLDHVSALYVSLYVVRLFLDRLGHVRTNYIILV